MNRLVKIGLAVVVIAAPFAAQADDQDVMNYRKQIMRTMSEQAGAMNMTLQGKAPAEAFATHVKTLHLAATQALKAFEPNVPGSEGGESKPEVWSQWDDFSKRMNELVANLEALDKAAAEGGAAKAGPMIQQAMTCRGCHDTYRIPK